MYPAFRSERSASWFCILLVMLLLLPFFLFWVGLPPRKQAYGSTPIRFAVPGHEIGAIYDNPQSPDILFLGSSLTWCAIQPHELERSLSRSTGRPVHVEVLGMAWHGLDLQYFLLRDYLQRHHPDLIVLNTPYFGEAPSIPHGQAYHWFRYGEFRGDFQGLPPQVKAEVYAHMVLGGPRDLLARFRPNLVGSDEMLPSAIDKYLSTMFDSGYRGAPFVREHDLPTPTPQARLLSTSSTLFSPVVQPPAYSAHFFQSIVALAGQYHCRLVLLHVPEDLEYGKASMPEYAWPGGGGLKMIGVPTDTLYAGMSREQFLHYYADHHLNKNGSELFTAAITPALIEAFDEDRAQSQSPKPSQSSSRVTF